MKVTVKAAYNGWMWIGTVVDCEGRPIGIVNPDGSYKFSITREVRS